MAVGKMSNPLSFLLVLVIIPLLVSPSVVLKPAYAQGSNVYIVYLGATQHYSPKYLTEMHYDMLATLMESKELAQELMVYSYRHGFSGFAAKLTASQAQQLSEHPDVVGIMPNSLYKPQTTRSWDYLGLSSQAPDNVLSQSKMGDGVIIGVLDTGIWPESKSFTDEGLGAIPSGWNGFCQSGDQFNPAKHCNKKVIGARWFVDGLLAEIGRPVNLTGEGEIASARDVDGHGTHVSSTAAGAYVANVSYNNVGLGTARGGAPHARLAIYKVCWKLPSGQCAAADILKGLDEAIKDGVHVLTLSIGRGILPLFSEADGRDAIAVGSFHAVERGITVVCGGGNEGPSPQTIKNTAPWIITVAASTMDRAFLTQITLGNNKTFQGQAIYTGSEGGSGDLYYPGDDVYYPGDDDGVASKGVCERLPVSQRFTGKIVLCFTSLSSPAVTPFVSLIVRASGGAGVIVSKAPNAVTGDCRGIPCAEVDYEIGTQILFYIRSTRNPVAKLNPPTTFVGKAVSARIAEFSSRGPSSTVAAILKPDITAPGVQIIAATSDRDTTAKSGFTMLSGTSMSTPHISGIVALLKALHPEWSPAAIRSALTTTAWTSDQYGIPIFADGSPPKLADPFDYGGGIANPNEAACPGLVYDMDTTDYINYLCSTEYNSSAISKLTGKPVTCPKTFSVLDVNLPSITIPHLRNSTTLTRTVTNVGATNSIYHVIVKPPTGTLVFVNPPMLIFNSGVKKISFEVTVISMHQLSAGYYFGSLIWTDGIHDVKSTIAVRTAMLQAHAAAN